jgi:hypothetical protein
MENTREVLLVAPGMLNVICVNIVSISLLPHHLFQLEYIFGSSSIYGVIGFDLNVYLSVLESQKCT